MTRGLSGFGLFVITASLGVGLCGCNTSTSGDDAGFVLPDGGPVWADDSGLPAGIAKTCAVAADCQSGSCGSNGLCCNSACEQSDRLCGATACDLSGACLYPDNNTPCGSACAGGMITASYCDGAGNCNPQAAVPCAVPYGCAVGGTACATSCIDDSNCAANASCNGEGACVPRQATGFCTSNDQCTSGICGMGGTGACCVAACDTTDAICGATACDPNSGACIYQLPDVGCGLSRCSANQESRGVCDGKGKCGAPVAHACPGYLTCLSDSSGCKASCITAQDCTPGAFCDLGGQTGGVAVGACCPNWQNDTLYVDSDLGSDGPCCGEGQASDACATVTRAMALVRERQLYGATIQLAPKSEVDPNTGACAYWGDTTNHSVAQETFPLELGYGVTLTAVGGQVCFFPYFTNGAFSQNGSGCSGPYAVIQVSPFPEEDGGVLPADGGAAVFPAPVTIRGLTLATQAAVPALLVGPLYDPINNYSPAFAPYALFCGGAPPSLQGTSAANLGAPAGAILDNVGIYVGGGGGVFPALSITPPSEPNIGPAVFVGPSSSLTLGPGPVTINLNYDTSSNYLAASEALDGIDCIGAPGEWATLQDVPGATSPILAIGPTSQSELANLPTGQQQTNALPAEISLIHCNLNLSAGPTLGAPSFSPLSGQETGCIFDSLGIEIGLNIGATDQGWFGSSAFAIGEGEQDAGFVFGSSALPGLIRCMGRDGIFVPGQFDENGNPLPGPTLYLPGATIRYNDGAGIHLESGSLVTSNTALVANNVGLEVDGMTDSAGNTLGGGDEQVTLGAGTILACNGSNDIYPTAPPYDSSMFSVTSHTQATNAGADLWDQNTGIVIDARGLAWTDYNTTKGSTAVASCDSSCFETVWPNAFPAQGGGSCNCTCAGPGCPAGTFTVIPDDLDIVQWAGATVHVGGGSLLDPSYCSNIGGP